MPRLIKCHATGPVEVPPGEKSAWICACGLTSKFPLCDGSHKHAKQQEEDGCCYRYEATTAIKTDDIATHDLPS